MNTHDEDEGFLRATAASEAGNAARESLEPRYRDVGERVKRQFLDDLSAANLLKTYLISNGVEVPAEVLAGLASLTTHYSGDEEALNDPPEMRAFSRRAAAAVTRDDGMER